MIFIPHWADNLFKRRGSASDQEMASIEMLLVLIQHIGKGLIELPVAKLRLSKIAECGHGVELAIA